MATEAQTVQPQSPPQPVPAEYGERHVFYSKGENFRVVREALIDQWMNVGQGALQIARMNPQTAIAYTFPAGICVVHEGQDIRPDGPLGQEQDAVQYLRGRSTFNVYFWEEGAEPGRLLPTEQEVFDTLIAAAGELRSEVVEQVLADERNSHNRTLIIRMCEKTLKNIAENQKDIDRRLAEAGIDPAAPLDPSVAALRETAAQAEDVANAPYPEQATATGAEPLVPPTPAPSLADAAGQGPPPPPKPPGYDEGVGVSNLSDEESGTPAIHVEGRDAGFEQDDSAGPGRGIAGQE